MQQLQASTSTERPPRIAWPTADSALKIWTGSLATSFAAGLLGSALGVLQMDPARPATQLAFRGAANTFAVTFPFFAIREGVVNPVLLPYTSVYSPAQGTFTPTSSPHTRNLAASTISAALVGGSIVGFSMAQSNQDLPFGEALGPDTKGTRQPPRQAVGMLSKLGNRFLPYTGRFALLGFVGQLAFNEANVLRIKWVVRREKKLRDQEEQAIQRQVAGRLADGLERPSEELQSQPRAELNGIDGEVRALAGGESSTPNTDSEKEPWYTPLIPIRRMSDTEYRKRLQDQRDKFSAELEEVRRAIAKEQSLGGGEQDMQQQQQPSATTVSQSVETGRTRQSRVV